MRAAGLRALRVCGLAMWTVAMWAVAQEPPAATGLHTDVVFGDYSPLSSNAELMRRLLTPLAAAQVKAKLSLSSEHLIEQSIDLGAERFALYVPPSAPPHAYALLVFVPPWDDARLPSGWAGVLDEHGMIYVSAARSGNDQNVLARREPLALLAAYNVMRRYAVDATRVYVAGFSGGARVALHLALGYPDVFRGALLNAGSDPLGEFGEGAALVPPRELLERFQESSRLVYVTGEQDVTHLAMDAHSLRSMRSWCVFDVNSTTIPGAAHEIATPAALSAALQALLAPARPDPVKLASCRSDIDRSLAGQLEKAKALLAAGQRAAAEKRLLEIDRRFGGLAAPASIELQAALGAAAAARAPGRESGR
jgi:pimeloyl-ACP methyl ester carboxylesterase